MHYSFPSPGSCSSRPSRMFSSVVQTMGNFADSGTSMFGSVMYYGAVHILLLRCVCVCVCVLHKFSTFSERHAALKCIFFFFLPFKSPTNPEKCWIFSVTHFSRTHFWLRNVADLSQLPFVAILNICWIYWKFSQYRWITAATYCISQSYLIADTYPTSQPLVYSYCHIDNIL